MRYYPSMGNSSIHYPVNSKWPSLTDVKRGIGRKVG